MGDCFGKPCAAPPRYQIEGLSQKTYIALWASLLPVKLEARRGSCSLDKPPAQDPDEPPEGKNYVFHHRNVNETQSRYYVCYDKTTNEGCQEELQIAIRCWP